MAFPTKNAISSGRNEGENLVFSEAPASPDAVAGKNPFGGEPVDGSYVHLKQYCHFGRGQDLIQLALPPIVPAARSLVDVH